MEYTTLLVVFAVVHLLVVLGDQIELSTSTYKIEGKIIVSDEKFKGTDWISETQVLVDGGEYKGFLKADGSFSIGLVPPGSYLVEVASPNYLFEPYRVDITKGGKIRARRSNFLQASSVQVVPYPLKFVATQQAPFFEIREQWKVTDFVLNPMVLMMVLPLLFVFVMPRLLSLADPEAQKEMQSQMSALNQKQQLPEISELFSNWFGGSGDSKKKRSAVKDTVSRKAGKRR